MSLARVFELREAMSQAGAVQGFIMDRRTQDSSAPAPGAPPQGELKNILDVQKYLHEQQGFGRIIHGH